MGAGASTESLVISKIARKTSFEAAELHALHAKFKELAQARDGGGGPDTGPDAGPGGETFGGGGEGGGGGGGGEGKEGEEGNGGGSGLPHGGSGRGQRGSALTRSTMVTLDEFDAALAEVGVVEKDQIMINVLFKHFDGDSAASGGGSGAAAAISGPAAAAAISGNGDDLVDGTAFLLCCAPMVSGDVAAKLRFGFDLLGAGSGRGAGTTTATRPDYEAILTAVNATASWFGDPTLSAAEIETLLEDAFSEVQGHCVPAPAPEGGGAAAGLRLLDYDAYLRDAGAAAGPRHPLLVAFVAGQGTGPRRSKDDLAALAALPLSPTSPVALESFAAMDAKAAEIRAQARAEAAKASGGDSLGACLAANAALPPKSPGAP